MGRILFVNVTRNGAYSNHFLESFKYLGKFMWTGIVGRCGGALLAGLSVDRIPGEARFFAPMQNLPGAHPAFCIYSGNASVYLGVGEATGAWR